MIFMIALYRWCFVHWNQLAQMSREHERMAPVVVGSWAQSVLVRQLYITGAHGILSPSNMHSHHFVLMRTCMHDPCMGSIGTCKYVSLKTFGVSFAHIEAVCPWKNGHCPICIKWWPQILEGLHVTYIPVVHFWSAKTDSLKRIVA